mmetsp:Transcript_8754/g.27210  ORF Transcript_8754/g.27210 Transcript_8754/m.27210 type:complete len:584 (+) Transcript_8754:3121-4872(+)
MPLLAPGLPPEASSGTSGDDGSPPSSCGARFRIVTVTHPSFTGALVFGTLSTASGHTSSVRHSSSPASSSLPPSLSASMMPTSPRRGALCAGEDAESWWWLGLALTSACDAAVVGSEAAFHFMSTPRRRGSVCGFDEKSVGALTASTRLSFPSAPSCPTVQWHTREPALTVAATLVYVIALSTSCTRLSVTTPLMLPRLPRESSSSGSIAGSSLSKTMRMLDVPAGFGASKHTMPTRQPPTMSTPMPPPRLSASVPGPATPASPPSALSAAAAVVSATVAGPTVMRRDGGMPRVICCATVSNDSWSPALCELPEKPASMTAPLKMRITGFSSCTSPNRQKPSSSSVERQRNVRGLSGRFSRVTSSLQPISTCIAESDMCGWPSLAEKRTLLIPRLPEKCSRERIDDTARCGMLPCAVSGVMVVRLYVGFFAPSKSIRMKDELWIIVATFVPSTCTALEPERTAPSLMFRLNALRAARSCRRRTSSCARAFSPTTSRSFSGSFFLRNPLLLNPLRSGMTPTIWSLSFSCRRRGSPGVGNAACDAAMSAFSSVCSRVCSRCVSACTVTPAPGTRFTVSSLDQPFG